MLAAADYVQYTIDKTDDNYFNAFIFKRVREDMAISLDMTLRCQRLAKENRKQSWIPLFKTWVGIQYMYDKQPFTVKELCDVTGLSAYQIRESKRILEKDNLFITSRAYAYYDRCLGSNVDLNGIYEENRMAVEQQMKQNK
jgi:predicted transcriptional regulator